MRYIEARPGVHAQIMKAFRVWRLRGAKRAVSVHKAQVHILKLAKICPRFVVKLYTVRAGFFPKNNEAAGGQDESSEIVKGTDGAFVFRSVTNRQHKRRKVGRSNRTCKRIHQALRCSACFARKELSFPSPRPHKKIRYLDNGNPIHFI